MRDVNRILDIELPEDGDWTMVNRMLVALAGRIPESGAELLHKGVKLVVLDASPRHVRTVRVIPNSLAARPSPDAAQKTPQM